MRFKFDFAFKLVNLFFKYYWPSKIHKVFDSGGEKRKKSGFWRSILKKFL